MGGTIAAVFYGLILFGPLELTLLRRYCLSHPVAIASVGLFFVGLVSLAWKWWQAGRQAKLSTKANAILHRLVTDGEEIAPSQRARWLLANWESQSTHLGQSWFGARILRALDLQISRGRRHPVEQDLKTLSETEADRQHDSFSLLRIINWAMPMLGFLGTVLGISQTLGQLDTKLLATQQEQAMNQLTAGLYVAFDTTAIALVLTVFLMFMQFGISRLEQTLLEQIDTDSSDCLVPFLSADPHDAQDSLLSPIRELMEEMIGCVRTLVVEQSTIWSHSISETRQQWDAWTQGTVEAVETRFSDRVGETLQQHIGSLEKLQDEGNRQLELRWQQWQTTLSEQARLIQGNQKEVSRQSDTLQRLVDSTTELRKLEDTIHDSVARLENIHRLEEASVCIGEAVAVLATCLERSGVIRGTPIKPRPKQTIESESSENNTPANNARERKAA